MTCPHHWKIESPTGPTSRGVCQRCGAQREFVNHMSQKGLKAALPELPPVSLVDPVANKVWASARARKAQASRRRFEKVCPICQQPFSAYFETQMTCRAASCRRKWKWRDLPKGKRDGVTQ